MTELNDWDNELSSLAAEVNELTHKHFKVQIRQKRGLVARKIATIQSHLKIEQNIKKLKSLCEREFLLLPRERALLYWSGIFTETVEKYYQLKQENMTKKLWLRLIRTRINGADHISFSNFDKDDLVSLSVRHANLAKTEKYLGELLANKRQQKKAAIQRYQELSIAQINRSSSKTLQGRLGTNLKHALENPVVKTLEQAIIQMTSTIHKSERFSEIQAIKHKYEKESDSLLTVCRKYVLASENNPTWTPSTKAMARVESAIAKLDSLEKISQNSFNLKNSSNIPDAQPNFVHNVRKEVKTIFQDKN